MKPNTTHWLEERLTPIAATDLYPVLEIGPQATSAVQHTPHADAASTWRGAGKVWRVDRVAGPGVDIVGDWGDPAFLQSLVSQVQVRTVLLRNVLHHVPDRFAVARAVMDLLPENGHLLVTGPSLGRFDPAPLDTLFRPAPDHVAALFPHARLVAATTFRDDAPSRSGFRWPTALRQIPPLFLPAHAYAVELRKETAAAPAEPINVVVIGRNEAAQLPRVLRSVIHPWSRVVYVDSGSRDASVAVARSLGVGVVELDASAPYTAARGRNAGFAYLQRLSPAPRWVQFVDGDCEVTPHWWATALTALQANPQTAIVTGRVRERYGEASIYNRLCDIEWNTPVGELTECGGRFLMRAEAFAQVNGFNPLLIAGEEPEMCIRLRQHGWKLYCLDAELGWHDANMTRFGQWWQREVRGGYASSEGAAMHGHTPYRHRVREVKRNWVWGGIAPLLIVAAVLAMGPLGLLLGLVYASPLYRAYRSVRHRLGVWESFLYAVCCTAGKFPRVFGQWRYWRGRMFGRPSSLIEYKGPQVSPTAAPAPPAA